MVDVFENVMETAQKEVTEIALKEKLKTLDKVKLMIYSNIYNTFFKMNNWFERGNKK